MRNPPLLEVRDQENNEYSLASMMSKYFKNLEGEKDVTDKIIPFIGLVVFGIVPNK